MALRFKLQLVVIADDDQQVSVDELVVLAKEHERLEHLGLSLAEAKVLLLEVQRQILGRQIAAFLFRARRARPAVGTVASRITRRSSSEPCSASSR